MCWGEGGGALKRRKIREGEKRRERKTSQSGFIEGRGIAVMIMAKVDCQKANWNNKFLLNSAVNFLYASTGSN
jgi:hypothetical protein